MKVRIIQGGEHTSVVMYREENQARMVIVPNSEIDEREVSAEALAAAIPVGHSLEFSLYGAIQGLDIEAAAVAFNCQLNDLGIFTAEQATKRPRDVEIALGTLTESLRVAVMKHLKEYIADGA